MPKVIISGGGSGGHIFPAIAIANQLKKSIPNVDILFVGAKGKMEMEKVPKAGYKIEGLWISGIQRRLTIKNLSFPLKLISSLYRSYRILRKFKPDIAIGVGGFASGPLLKMATIKGIPTLIQEQNSFPGITNRLLAKKVDSICVAYDNMDRFFPNNKILKTGNPVRLEMVNIEGKKSEGQTFFDLQTNKKTVLIIGGSLGARSVNNAMMKFAADLSASGIQVIWQTGKIYYQDIINQLDISELPNIKILQFIERMDLAYAAADIVVSRAGAMSISELCLVGKPAILVPSPNVAEDHQTKNASALADKDAAILIKDTDIETKLKNVILDTIEDEQLMTNLSTNISQMADAEATADIGNEILKLIKK